MNERNDDISAIMREGSTELFRYGTVDADHAGGTGARVRMDGEDDPGVVGHGYVQAYDGSTAPAANERVMMMRYGKKWVILGKVI